MLLLRLKAQFSPQSLPPPAGRRRSLPALCSASEIAFFRIYSPRPTALPPASSPSIASSPVPPPPRATPSRSPITSSPDAASPESRPSRHPKGSPASGLPRCPTPSSPSWPASTSGTDLATVVANDPKLLCADVGKTLSPRVAGLCSLGLSSHQVGQVVLAARNRFRSGTLLRNFQFWLGVFGSLDELLRHVKMNPTLLTVDLEKIAKPNLALLQRCGIQISDIPCTFASRMLVRSTKRLQEALARVAEFGIQQGSWAFPFAFMRFAIFNLEKLDSNIQMFEKLGWSRADIASAVRKAPNILNLTPERVQKSLDFLMGDVGLQMPDIVYRPVFLLYSVERRLLPRYCLMKFLKGRGLMTSRLSFRTIALMGNDNLLAKLVHPHETSVPGLAAAYASSCAGKHQWELLGDMTKGERKS